MYLTQPFDTYELASFALKAQGWIWDPAQSGYYLRNGQRAIVCAVRRQRNGTNAGLYRGRLVRER